MSCSLLSLAAWPETRVLRKALSLGMTHHGAPCLSHPHHHPEYHTSQEELPKVLEMGQPPSGSWEPRVEGPAQGHTGKTPGKMLVTAHRGAVWLRH